MFCVSGPVSQNILVFVFGSFIDFKNKYTCVSVSVVSKILYTISYIINVISHAFSLILVSLLYKIKGYKQAIDHLQ